MKGGWMVQLGLILLIIGGIWWSLGWTVGHSAEVLFPNLLPSWFGYLRWPGYVFSIGGIALLLACITNGVGVKEGLVQLGEGRDSS